MPEDNMVIMCSHAFQCEDAGFETNEKVDVIVRPEDIQVVDSDSGMLQGTVESVIFKGVHYEMMIGAGGFRWKIHSTEMHPVGSTVGLNITPYYIHIMRKEQAE